MSVSTLRRLPVPVAEPPFDDELGPLGTGRTSTPADAMQGTLALSFVLPSGLPAVPEPRALHLAPPLHVDDEFDAQPTPRALLTDPRQWAAQLVQAVVEVVAGDRPSTQLIRWTTPEVYTDVRTATQTFWTASHRRHRQAKAASSRVFVRSVHVCEPADGTAEVCATVLRHGRAAAVALRLVGVDGRWLCTALQLG